MSDAKGMKFRIAKAVLNGNTKAIDKAIQEIWHDGYGHGFRDGYDKTCEEAEVK